MKWKANKMTSWQNDKLMKWWDTKFSLLCVHCRTPIQGSSKIDKVIKGVFRQAENVPRKVKRKENGWKLEMFIVFNLTAAEYALACTTL